MVSEKWQIAHRTYLALLIILFLICVFLNTLTCIPLTAQYSLQAIAKISKPRATIKCLNINAVSLATRNLHIISDLLLIPVPLIIIWRTQMKIWKKLRIMSVFGIGLISSAASIVRNVLTSRQILDLTCKSISWAHHSQFQLLKILS